MANIFIRNMKMEDLDGIARIDADIMGVVRKDYYREKLNKCLLEENKSINFVAIDGEKVVGFIMGDIFTGEYGLQESTAVIDTIGVSPQYQGFGIAKKLFKEFLNSVNKLGIKNVYTIIDWDNYSLLRFFHGEGFSPSKKLTLELKL